MNELQITEYDNVRVLTTQQIAEAYDAAVRMALVALEKQIPVKPIILDELNGDIDYECPLCGKQVMSDAESRNNYCGECGCKFDWSEIDAKTNSKSQ